jgi:hypothetical protein
MEPISHLVAINTTQSAKGGKTFQYKTSEGHIGSPILPSNDSFPLYLRGMYRQSLDVRRYAAIYALTDAPRRYGARLGFIDIAGNSKVPRSAQQFREEIRHRTFPEGPDNPASPVGRDSFAAGPIGVHSPDVPKDGRRGQVQHFQEPPVNGLCLTPLGENAPIPWAHVPG